MGKSPARPLYPGLMAVLLCFFLMVSGASGSMALRKEETGKKWAVVIGINRYMKEVTSLSCAVSDARAFRDVLVQTGGFQPDNIFLLTSDQQGNRFPDRPNIIRWISYIKQNAGPGDTCLFFFSGHGMDMDKESFLLTCEADPYSRETLEASSLRISDLKRYMEGIQAGTILIFIDACRNDPRAGKGEKNNSLTENFSKNLVISAPHIEGVKEPLAVTFFSCRVGQRSYEWTEKGLGFFTYYLVQGLDGGARDSRGKVTIDSLERYLGAAIPPSVEKERGARQDPWIRRSGLSGGGDHILADPAKRVIVEKPENPPAGREHPGAPGTGEPVTTMTPLNLL